MKTTAKLVFLFLAMGGMNPSSAQDVARRSVFIVTPQAGWLSSEVEYTAPGSGARQQIKDSGALYGINLVFADPKFALGALLHNAKTGKSDENGYLFFSNYYFRDTGTLQPTLGVNIDYIDVYTQLPQSEAAPLLSLDVKTSILVLYPTVGVSFKADNYRITPFVGFFNEQVDTVVTSPGMLIGGSVRNGFRSAASVVADYYAAGAKFELSLLRFLRLDLKAYVRFKQNETPLYTSRNRLDVYLSRTLGVSAKFDYFQDRNESLTFFTIGPSFVFY